MSAEFQHNLLFCFEKQNIDEIYKSIVWPFLTRYETACVSPFISTYSTTRLTTEKIEKRLVIAAFLHYYSQKKLSPEEKFCCITFLNDCQGKDVCKQYFYVLFRYEENILVKSHVYTTHRIPIKEFLFAQGNYSTHSQSRQFMALCFGRYNQVDYNTNSCFRNDQFPFTPSMRILPLAFKSIDTVCESIVENDVFDKKSSVFPFIAVNNNHLFCKIHSQGIIGIDLCIKGKDVDPTNKILTLPRYTACVSGTAGNMYDSDNHLDQFLFEHKNQSLKVATAKRASELYCLVRLLFQRNIICNKIVSYVILEEQRLAAILLWEKSPQMFRETVVEKNAICWPLMMPFDQRAHFSVNDITVRPLKDDLTLCDLEDEEGYSVRIIERDNLGYDEQKDNGIKGHEVAVFRYQNLFLIRFASSNVNHWGINTNIATNLILIRSNRKINGPISGISLRAIGMAFFAATAQQTLIRVDRDGYEWHACSLCPLTTNQNCLSLEMASNLRINSLFDTTHLDNVMLYVSWEKEVENIEPIQGYFRDFNVLRSCEQGGAYGLLFT